MNPFKGKSKKEIQYLIDKSGRKDQISLHDDHALLTRRDLLNSGLIGFSGWMLTPSLLTMISSPSFADTGKCSGGDEGGAQWPAFVAINLRGGAALAGNLVVTNSAKGLLSDYSKLGLGTPAAISAATAQEFGGANFYAQSGILAGIRAQANATVLSRSAFMSVVSPSNDDNSNNTMDPSGMIMRAGLTGSLLANMGNTAAQGTGISMRPAKQIVPPAPLAVNNVNSIRAALAPSGVLASQLNAQQRTSVFNLVNSLSGTQARRLASANSSSSAKTIGELVECATGKNISLAGAAGPIVSPQDAPVTDPGSQLIGVWQLNNTGAVAGRDQNSRIAMAAMVYNALNGQAATVGIDLGGYDYHGNARATTDALDNNVGQVIGWVLSSAAAMNKKVMIHVTTDGSVDAPQGSAIGAAFTSDQGSHGTNYLLFYDPAGRPAIDTQGYQIGHFTAGGNADNTTMVGNTDNAACAAFANYMRFAGKTDLINKVVNLTPIELSYMIRLA